MKEITEPKAIRGPSWRQGTGGGARDNTVVCRYRVPTGWPSPGGGRGRKMRQRRHHGTRALVDLNRVPGSGIVITDTVVQSLRGPGLRSDPRARCRRILKTWGTRCPWRSSIPKVQVSRWVPTSRASPSRSRAEGRSGAAGGLATHRWPRRTKRILARDAGHPVAVAGARARQGAACPGRSAQGLGVAAALHLGTDGQARARRDARQGIQDAGAAEGRPTHSFPDKVSRRPLDDERPP